MFLFPPALATASSSKASQLFGDVLPWLIVLIALVIVGGAIIYYVKRLTTTGSTGASEPFTLQGLREMRASGQITDEEFERARAAMIGRLKAPADEETPTSNGDDDASSEAAPGDNDENASGNGENEQKSQ